MWLAFRKNRHRTQSVIARTHSKTALFQIERKRLENTGIIFDDKDMLHMGLEKSDKNRLYCMQNAKNSNYFKKNQAPKGTRFFA